MRAGGGLAGVGSTRGVPKISEFRGLAISPIAAGPRGLDPPDQDRVGHDPARHLGAPAPVRATPHG